MLSFIDSSIGIVESPRGGDSSAESFGRAAGLGPEFSAWSPWEILISAMRGVGLFGQFVQQVEKGLALADE